MARMQLVELEDLPWFPQSWRDAGTAYLEWAVRVSGHARMLLPKVREALAKSGETEILDLCSGGGGPTLELGRALVEDGSPIRIRLTDLYPNVAAFEAAKQAHPNVVDFIPEPVDATAVGPDRGGLRLLFNSFHHLPPELAVRVLADAVAGRKSIGVFEIVGRQAVPLIGIAFAPITFALTLPIRRPFRWAWAFWTYIVPVLPAFVAFDGFVSCLRVYAPDELRALVTKVPGQEQYDWDIGQIQLGSAPAHATYLVGTPRGR